MIFRRDEGQRDWIDSELSKIHWPDSSVGRCCCWVMRKLLHVASYSRHSGFPWHASTIVSWRHPCLMAKHGLFTSTWDVLDCLQATGMVQQELQALEYFRRWVDRGGLVILSDTSFQTFNAFKLYYHRVVSLEVGVSRAETPGLVSFCNGAYVALWPGKPLDQKVPKKTGQGKPMEMESHRPTFLDPKNSFKSNQWSAQESATTTL